MSAKIKRERQLDVDGSRELFFADIAAGMDNGRMHYGSVVSGAVKVIAVVLLAVVVVSILLMSMPGLIDDKIETIHFRVGDAATVELPSYVQLKPVGSDGTQTQGHRKQLANFDFTPPNSAMAHITRIARYRP